MRLHQVLRTLVYAAGFFAGWGYLAVLMRGLDPALGISIPSALRPFGSVLAIPGVALALTCAFWFAIVGRGTPAPFDAPRVFVASGPYRFVRNPMYLGFAAGLAGWGIQLGSPGVLLLAVLFVGILHVFVVAYEEHTLRERFGDSYREYCARVGRWVPWPPRR